MKNFSTLLVTVCVAIATLFSASAADFVLLKNTAGWSAPTVWAWNADGNQVANDNWPGDPMTDMGDGTWRWELPAGKTLPTGIIFSDNGSSQTADLTYSNGATYDCSGNIVEGGDTPVPPTPGTDVTVYWDNSAAQWSQPMVHYWGGNASTWPGEAMNKVEGNVWSYTCPAGTSGLVFNDGNGAQTGDYVAVNNHIYNMDGDQGEYKGDTPIPPTPGNYPATLYIIGNVDGTAWSTVSPKGVSGDNGVYTFNAVTIDDAGEGSGYFAFITVTGSDWDTEVNLGDRYGAPAKDTPVTLGTAQEITLYAAGVNASASESWMVDAGTYDIIADLSTMKLTVTGTGGVEVMLGNDNSAAEYYNLQGVRVANPSNGIFIKRTADGVAKVYVK